MDLLRQEGYEIKRGKHIPIKGRAQKRFIRLDSLHVGFRTQDLMQILENAQKSPSVQHTPGKRQRIDLLVDLQAKIQEGKGARELGAAGIVKVELGELGKLLENFAESALVFSVNLFAVV